MLGRTLLSQRKLPEAEAALSEALSIFRERYRGAHHSLSATFAFLKQVLEARGDRAGLDALAREDAEYASVGLTSDMAGSFELADLYVRMGRSLTAQSKRNELFDEIERRLMALLQAVVEESPKGMFARELRGHKLRDWATALPLKGEYQASAERAFQQAITVFEELAVDSPESPIAWHFLADTLRCLGNVYEQNAQADKAEAAYRRAVELLDGHPHSSLSNSDERAAGYFALANLLARTERVTEAEPLHQKGCEIMEASLDRRAPNAADYNELAWRLATSPVKQFRNPTRAVGLAKKAVDLRR